MMGKRIAVAVELTILKDVRDRVGDIYTYLNDLPTVPEDLFNRRIVLVGINKLILLLDSIISTGEKPNGK